IQRDLDQAWEVLAEAIQTCMRRYGIVDAYERLKNATRGQRVERSDLQNLVKNCEELPSSVQDRLSQMLPGEYVGFAAELVDRFVAERQHAIN
ncbi:MAG: hypothetical protein NTX25_00795, partial [Proteobacteria bacterium]|nr:hypothetical protein [Pseudomonadota bacterium]